MAFITGRQHWSFIGIAGVALLVNTLLLLLLVGGHIDTERRLIEMKVLAYGNRDRLEAVQKDMQVGQLRFGLTEQHIRLIERQLELRPLPPHLERVMPRPQGAR